MKILGWMVVVLAVVAYLKGDTDAARYFVLMAMLLGISAQVSDLRDEIRAPR